MFRVVVVDDNDMIRLSLNTLLQTCEEVEVIAEAADGREAFKMCCSLKPDVVIMDLVMPHMDGVAATRAILDCHPTARIIILTSTVESDLIEAALEAGAKQWLAKGTQITEIIDAVLEVA